MVLHGRLLVGHLLLRLVVLLGRRLGWGLLLLLDMLVDGLVVVLLRRLRWGLGLRMVMHVHL